MTETDKERIARLKRWVSDLQSGMYINCVYCGHRYGPKDEVPVAMADVLKEHIAECPEHPLSKVLKERNELWDMLHRVYPPLGYGLAEQVTRLLSRIRRDDA
jgi:DNA-directed RNA polymerase subunit RPC12/RpoP